MRGDFNVFVLFGLMTAVALAQEPEPAVAPTAPASASSPVQETPSSAWGSVATPPPRLPAPKRGLITRILHPFSGSGKPGVPPAYKDPKLRGLILDVQISPQPVKLSEVRQLSVKATLINKGKKGVELDFNNDQRIEIHLMNTAEVVLTKWSENHAIKDKPGAVLINPQEHIEYNETIATRELAPDKVYIAEVFFPKYPEIRVRQKFLTAP